MRILLTLADVAEPTDTGYRLRAAAIIRGLCGIGDVDVAVLFSDRDERSVPVPQGLDVAYWRLISPPPRSRWQAAYTALRTRTPWRIAAQDWVAVRSDLAKWVRPPYDLVWFGAADHQVQLRDMFGGVIQIVDYDDIESSKTEAFLTIDDRGFGHRLERTQRLIELAWWKRIERTVADTSNVSVVCSDLDATRLRASHAVVLPNTCPDPGAPDSAHDESIAGQYEFVMLANYAYEPNVDAARFAAEAIAPILVDALPGARILLAGKRSTQRLADLGRRQGVHVLGEVPAVTPLLRRACAVIAPLRYGGGTRLKIIEAFAHAAPVVSTTVGAEGLGVQPGVHLLIGDDAESFADSCVRLGSDPALRAEVGHRGRLLYKDSFAPERATKAVRQAVDIAMSQLRPSPVQGRPR